MRKNCRLKRKHSNGITRCLLSGMLLLYSCSNGRNGGSDTDSETENGNEVVWIAIPGGTFDMGSEDGAENEQPVHSVTVPDFEMTKSEVTVAQYEGCVEEGSCSEPGTSFEECNWGESGYESQPVNCVDWYQAIDFCEWAGGRLPSEAEWEYAARSGGQDIAYPWGNEEATCDYAVMNDESHDSGCDTGRTWEICSKQNGNNTQGLCDLAGNVWEWVQDNYHSSYVGAPTDGSAWEDSSSDRIQRGGGYFFDAYYQRATIRSDSPPTIQYYDLGFRCAK